MKILVVEDEQKVASFIKRGLEENTYDVDVASDGFIGQKMALANSYDLVLLDIILPAISGLEVCKKIKSVKPGLPILMLTALGTTANKVTGFEAGADDYLLKPFEFLELLARIKALVRRSATPPPDETNLLTVADLQLDERKKNAIRSGKVIALTAKEFLLLEYLMKNKGRVISRVELAEEIWEVNFDTGTNVVEVYINILRKKIDRDYPNKLIHTRIGFGYIFEEEA